MALTAGKSINRQGPSRGLVKTAVKAGQTFFKGGLACVDATGFLVVATTATGLKVRGIVDTGRDPKIVTAANGERKLACESGVFPFKNSAAGDQIVQADIENDCFIVDDETVAKTNGSSTRSVAGKVVDIEGSIVWVKVGPL